jgi:protein ImuA
MGDAPPAARLWPGTAAPAGLLHEVRTDDWRAGPAAAGFALALAARLQGAHGGTLVFLEPLHEARREGALSGRGLAAFGIDPARALFIRPRKEEDLFWAAEEATRARDVAAAFLLMRARARRLTLTATRRLNLAAGESGTTPVIVRLGDAGNALTSAPMRWRVAPAPSAQAPFDAKAPGAPRWRVQVEKSARAAHVAPGALIHLVEWRHDERRFFLPAAAEAADPRALLPASADGSSPPAEGRSARPARAL